jgi:MFS family permease
VVNREDRRRYWRRPLRPLLVGLAIFAISCVIISYQCVAHRIWLRAMLGLAGSLVMVAVSIPIVVSATRAAGWSRTLRYFIVWSVGVCSVVGTLAYFFAQVQAGNAGTLFWAAAFVGIGATALWFVGFWVYVVMRMMRAIRSERNRPSHAVRE